MVGLFTGDGEELFEVGGESVEGVVLAGIVPSGFGEGGGGGIALDKLLGKFGGALELVSEFALVGPVERGESVAELVRGF